MGYVVFIDYFSFSINETCWMQVIVVIGLVIVVLGAYFLLF